MRRCSLCERPDLQASDNESRCLQSDGLRYANVWRSSWPSWQPGFRHRYAFNQHSHVRRKQHDERVFDKLRERFSGELHRCCCQSRKLDRRECIRWPSGVWSLCALGCWTIEAVLEFLTVVVWRLVRPRGSEGGFWCDVMRG